MSFLSFLSFFFSNEYPIEWNIKFIYGCRAENAIKFKFK